MGLVGCDHRGQLEGGADEPGSRLISVHRPDGVRSVPFTAVWIANKGAAVDGKRTLTGTPTTGDYQTV